MDGWSKLIIKLNSAQFGLNLPVGAEFGNYEVGEDDTNVGSVEEQSLDKLNES